MAWGRRGALAEVETDGDSPLTLRSCFPAWGVFQPQNSARCPEVTRNLGSGPEMPLEAAVFPGQSGERVPPPAAAPAEFRAALGRNSENAESRRWRSCPQTQAPLQDAGCVSSPPNSLLLPPASATCCPFSGKRPGPAVGWTQCLPHQPALPRAPRRGTCPPQSPESQCQRSKAHSRLHGPPPPLASHPV